MQQQETTGILLLNLGGPESLADVESFLYNLFSDRQIIRLGPPLLQKPIARMIARRRAPKSKASYSKIGGGSPISRITNQQAQALQEKLASVGRFKVGVCMRYWKPFAPEALEKMLAAGVNRIIALPLYPHYSIATTGSSLTDLQRTAQKLNISLPILEIRSWPDEPAYIRCMAKRIQEGFERFGNDPVEIVYSAHSLPKKFIEEGDPYVDETKITIAAIEKITGRQGHLCFQSRSGPVEWMEPSTPDMLNSLAQRECRNILMVPISFVSDHVETLYEIDVLYKDTARKLGMRLESTPGLNDDPEFIEALANLVLARLDQPTA
jgi:ferrochelatase